MSLFKKKRFLAQISFTKICYFIKKGLFSTKSVLFAKNILLSVQSAILIMSALFLYIVPYEFLVVRSWSWAFRMRSLPCKKSIYIHLLGSTLLILFCLQKFCCRFSREDPWVAKKATNKNFLSKVFLMTVHNWFII